MALFIAVGQILPRAGDLPEPATLQSVPLFYPAPTLATGLDVLAAAAAKQVQPITAHGRAGVSALTGLGPYNPAAILPPKVVKKILNLEFVEMADVRADIWVEDQAGAESGGTTPPHARQATSHRHSSVAGMLRAHGCTASNPVSG